LERGERERDVDWIVGGNLRGEMMRRGRGGVGEEERDRGYVDDEKMSKLVKEKLVSLLPRSNYQTLQPTKHPPPQPPPPPTHFQTNPPTTAPTAAKAPNPHIVLASTSALTPPSSPSPSLSPRSRNVSLSPFALHAWLVSG